MVDVTVDAFIEPETTMVSGTSRPVEEKRDTAASEAGSGGMSDLINATDLFERVATMVSGTDYAKESGFITVDTVVVKVGTTKLGSLAASHGGALEVDVATVCAVRE